MKKNDLHFKGSLLENLKFGIFIGDRSAVPDNAVQLQL